MLQNYVFIVLSNNKTPLLSNEYIIKEISDISDKINHYKGQRKYELNDAEFNENKFDKEYVPIR